VSHWQTCSPTGHFSQWKVSFGSNSEENLELIHFRFFRAADSCPMTHEVAEAPQAVVRKSYQVRSIWNLCPSPGYQHRCCCRYSWPMAFSVSFSISSSRKHEWFTPLARVSKVSSVRLTSRFSFVRLVRSMTSLEMPAAFGRSCYWSTRQDALHCASASECLAHLRHSHFQLASVPCRIVAVSWIASGVLGLWWFR
jgi:hypothetical protein